jgi:peroxiredoxin
MKLRFQIVLGVLILSIAINVLQARRIQGLELEMDKLSARGALAIGTVVPEIKAKDMEGHSTVIRFSDSAKPTVLYVFSPTCGYCVQNSEALNNLTAGISGRYRVVGLSLVSDGASRFVADHGIGFPVYIQPESATLVDLRLGVTPETIVISPEGKVLEDWRGAYVGGTGTLVENFFAIDLKKASL